LVAVRPLAISPQVLLVRYDHAQQNRLARCLVRELAAVPPVAGLPRFRARQNPPNKLNKPGGGG